LACVTNEKKEVRKEFFKLRNRSHSYNQCRKILLAKYGCEVTLRTLQRWTKRLNETEWDLTDKSRRPKTIHRKITSDIESEVIKIKNNTGWAQLR
jgi:transposase